MGRRIGSRAQPRGDLDLFASIGYANTRLDDFLLGGVQLAGNSFPFAPEWTASIGGTYTFGNGVYLSGDINFTDDAFTDVHNTAALKAESRTIVNLRVGYDADRWSVYAYADNVFDESYITNQITPGVITIGDSREVGVIFQAEF